MNIRNFALIAHVDHGKSTLADRIMELCGAVAKGHPDQMLDSLELEREHGITIKLKAIRLVYKPDNILRPIRQLAERGEVTVKSHPREGEDQILDQVENDKTESSRLRSNNNGFILNLIDTPGHVDFSYEVSRSLASVEGAVLVVDATQGVQAQTLANFHLALESNLVLIPTINKIDSPQAKIEETEKELIDIGFKSDEIVRVSAKTGEGVEDLLKEIIKRIPSPTLANTPGVKSSRHLETTPGVNQATQVLIFDSSLDPYKGVIATVRLFAGKVTKGDQIKFLATGATAEVLQIGYLTPSAKYVNELVSGEVGFIVTNLKDLSRVKVGDTITNAQNPAPALPGYQEAKPVVFLSFFPIDSNDFPKLKEAFEKLRLNDSSLTYSPETSLSLGQGLRVGFLGLLHAQITQERLEREYNLDIIVTSPSVNFIVDGATINKPKDFAPSSQSSVKEPIAKVTIFAPKRYYGLVNDLIYKRRGQVESFEDIGTSQKIEAIIPLLEVLIGFYDDLKSITSGFASFDFEVYQYRDAKLVKLDILVNYEPVEGLAQVVPVEKAQSLGRKLADKLKEVIPRQNIPIPIQAVVNYQKIKGGVGGKILARETIPAYRKDVTAKLYGGDVTRKTKLLEKQKKGKKRMKRFGSVDIPQEAFLAVLKI